MLFQIVLHALSSCLHLPLSSRIIYTLSVATWCYGMCPFLLCSPHSTTLLKSFLLKPWNQWKNLVHKNPDLHQPTSTKGRHKVLNTAPVVSIGAQFWRWFMLWHFLQHFDTFFEWYTLLIGPLDIASLQHGYGQYPTSSTIFPWFLRSHLHWWSLFPWFSHQINGHFRNRFIGDSYHKNMVQYLHFRKPSYPIWS